MAEFNKDDYLNDLPDADDFADKTAASAPAGSAPADGTAPADGQAAPGAGDAGDGSETRASVPADGDAQTEQDAAAGADSGDKSQSESESGSEPAEDTLTPLGKAKQEAAEYLEALQRERAEFINYRNRTKKDMERARQQGIIDVLAAELPALDDIDRIREHGGEMDESFQAVAAKIDKAFEKFGVEKFGEKGEDFDPTRHDAILHKPDPTADKEIVDTVVEAGYRIGDRVIRAARVVVASPQV